MNNAEQRRQDLLTKKDYAAVVQLAGQVLEQARQYGDGETFTQWRGYLQEAAAASGDPYYQALLDKVDPTLPVDKIGDFSHASALNGAAFKGNEKLVVALLERGAPVELANEKGVTPLMAAADEDHAAVIRILVKHGAKLEARDREGQTALHYTAWQNHLNAAGALLELGADPKAADAQGFAPIHGAAGKGATPMVRLLAPVTGVDCRIVGNAGTALMRASKSGHVETIAALLELGANPRLYDEEGDTALDYALLYRQDEAAGFLRSLRRRPPRKDDAPPPASALGGRGDNLVNGSPAGLALRLQWVEGERGGPSLDSQIAPEGSPDPTGSALWSIYHQAAAATPQGNWALPGASCSASRRAPLMHRVGEPLAYYKRGLDAFESLASPSAADSLVYCALLLGEAMTLLDAASEGMICPMPAAYARLVHVMGPTTREVAKPFGMVGHWLGGVTTLGMTVGAWEVVSAALIFAHKLPGQLQTHPGIADEMAGFFQDMCERAGDKLLEAEGPQVALQWVEDLRTAIETPNGLVLPLRELTRRVLSAAGQFPAVQRLAREVCEWARREGNQEALEDWQAHEHKAAFKSADPFNKGQCGEIEGLRPVDQVAATGRTALMGACASGNLEAANALLERGADVNFRDARGWTPLMVAANSGHPDMLSLMAKKGANLAARTDKGGESALHHAIWSGQIGAVQRLLELGADPRLEDQRGLGALEVARAAEREDIVALLTGGGR